MRAVPVLLVVLVAGCVTPADTPGPEQGALEDALAWQARTEAPTPRTEVAGAAIDGRFYVLGGFTAATTTALSEVSVATVEAYDPAADSWTTVADYPIPVHHTAAVAHDGSLFVFGGFAGTFTPTSLSFRYDPAADRWSPIAPLPAPRAAHAAAVLDGKAYVVGGYGLGFQHEATTLVYDLAADSWTTAAPILTVRDHTTAAALGRLIFVPAGDQRGHDNNVAAFEAYDPSADRWETLPEVPVKRGSLQAVAWDGRLVVLGGQNGTQTFADVDLYDPAARAWSKLPPLPTPRHGFAAVEEGGAVYALLGGPEPGLSVTGSVEVLTRS
ncbi:MAG: Kelch repeat-containing protein [Methanobacteriota archaeon]